MARIPTINRQLSPDARTLFQNRGARPNDFGAQGARASRELAQGLDTASRVAADIADRKAKTRAAKEYSEYISEASKVFEGLKQTAGPDGSFDNGETSFTDKLEETLETLAGEFEERSGLMTSGILRRRMDEVKAQFIQKGVNYQAQASAAKTVSDADRTVSNLMFAVQDGVLTLDQAREQITEVSNNLPVDSIARTKFKDAALGALRRSQVDIDIATDPALAIRKLKNREYNLTAAEYGGRLTLAVNKLEADINRQFALEQRARAEQERLEKADSQQALIEFFTAIESGEVPTPDEMEALKSRMQLSERKALRSALAPGAVRTDPQTYNELFAMAGDISSQATQDYFIIKVNSAVESGAISSSDARGLIKRSHAEDSGIRSDVEDYVEGNLVASSNLLRTRDQDRRFANAMRELSLALEGVNDREKAYEIADEIIKRYKKPNPNGKEGTPQRRPEDMSMEDRNRLFEIEEGMRNGEIPHEEGVAEINEIRRYWGVGSEGEE